METRGVVQKERAMLENGEVRVYVKDCEGDCEKKLCRTGQNSRVLPLTSSFR
jgi:hypothetical protein